MKKSLILIGILASAILAGCAAGTTTTENVAPGENPKWAEAGVHVASDGVVRNKEGKAYCTVMNEVVADEATAQKTEKNGVTYMFCCGMCPDKFAKDSTPYEVAKK